MSDTNVSTVAKTTTPSTNMMQVIERAATNPDVDISKMERLLDMQERILNKEAEGRFTAAMSDAQAEMRPVAADANNPQTKSKYASYAALDNAMRPIYTKHGFSLSFDTGDGAPENHVLVLCYVGHRDGFTRTYKVPMPADGKGAKGGDVMTKTHATGSAFTYGQRYLLKLIFNVAIGDDDDGNSAGTVKITPEQKETLIRLQKEASADTAAFLKFMGVETLDDIPADKMDKAVSALNAKITQKNAESANDC